MFWPIHMAIFRLLREEGFTVQAILPTTGTGSSPKRQTTYEIEPIIFYHAVFIKIAFIAFVTYIKRSSKR
jgi:hypothetical protein